MDPDLPPRPPRAAHPSQPAASTRRTGRAVRGRAIGSAWLLVASLAACGGGESEPGASPANASLAGAGPAEAPGPAAAPAPAAAPVSAPAPAAAPAPAPAAAAPSPAGAAPSATTARCTDPAALAQAVAEINRVRAAGATCGSTRYGPAGPVVAHPNVTQAALGHSTDMAQRQFFSHTGSDGSSIGTRLTAAGYAWSRAAENIAAGYPTVGAVVQGWVQSPGHCANLMNPALTDAGLACVPGPAGSAYSSYWTLAMGRPR